MKTEQRYKLKKLSDDYFEGNHPNQIYEGHTNIGTILKHPTIGERFVITGRGFNDFLSTSIVEKIIDDTKFKTTYSTYELVEYNED